MRFVVESGPHAGHQIEIGPGRSTVGRAQTSTLCLANDPTVSRNHLELNFNGRALSICDLASTSGTLVNGVAVSPGRSVNASVGDRIFLGQSVIRIDSVNSAAQTGPPPVVRKDQCGKCGTPFAFFGSHSKSTELPSFCQQCARSVREGIDRFRRSLQAEVNSWSGSPQALRDRASVRASESGVDLSLALSRATDISTAFLQRVLTFLLQDGALDEAEEKVFYAYLHALSLSEQQVPALMGQLRHYAFLRELRAGRLPSIRPSAMLPAGEIAHIEVPVVYQRELTSTYRLHQGLFLITNSRMIFTQTDAPFEVALSKVMALDLYPPNQFGLQLARRQGTGLYKSDQAFYLVEVGRAALDLHLRKKVYQHCASRSVPQDVRAAVWARDGGRCVQCGECEYLEFDHVIPFSKGGATSVGNIQLLCRRCNLTKSDRI